jgi:hypothetical protein
MCWGEEWTQLLQKKNPCQTPMNLGVHIRRRMSTAADLLKKTSAPSYLDVPAVHPGTMTCSFSYALFLLGAGIAQSVQRLATGWTTERSEFESQ